MGACAGSHLKQHAYTAQSDFKLVCVLMCMYVDVYHNVLFYVRTRIVYLCVRFS